MKFTSHIIKGKGLGKKIGYPTINLGIPKNFTLGSGVYACKVFFEKKSFRGALFYGSRETMSDSEKTLEIYILDENFPFKKIGSGMSLRVEAGTKIRDLQRFASVSELIKQIGRDVTEIKLVL